MPITHKKQYAYIPLCVYSDFNLSNTIIILLKQPTFIAMSAKVQGDFMTEIALKSVYKSEELNYKITDFIGFV